MLSQARPSSGQNTQALSRRPLVLVVDDEYRILRFLQAGLRLAGFDVLTAADGAQALRLLEEAKPAIIVVDINMIPMSGYEVIGSVRTSSNVPVIAMSGLASAASDALVLGANEFLAKPFRTEDLARQIDKLIGRRNDRLPV